MTRVAGLLLVVLVAVGCAGKQSANRKGTPTGGAARGRQNAAEELVRRVEEVYRDQERLTAGFRQRFFNKTFGLPKVSDGRVYLKKPSKLRLDYFSRRDRGKVSRSLIANGTTMWAVDIHGKWYYRHDLARSSLAVQVALLTGTGDLARRFDARFVTGSRLGATGDKVVELTPKTPSTTLKTVVLVVDPSDGRVRKVIATSPAGDTNEVDFFQKDTTGTVADAWFVFDAATANARGFRQIQLKAAPPASP